MASHRWKTHKHLAENTLDVNKLFIRLEVDAMMDRIFICELRYKLEALCHQKADS